ncbi:ABC transporter ATP-binding protein [Peptococcaceae bacterium 1198_IL3148]
MAENLMVEVTGLSVSYWQQKKEIPALKEVSFAIPAASTCALLGPSGCGKSTLLYVLAGLHDDYQGTVAVHGDPTLILQDYGLLPWKTVFDNVQLGLEIRGVSGEERADKVEQVLSEMGLWEMRHRYPSQLSGGQRQRVGIARSLALEPNLLLMDEPFSALDAITREKMQRQMLDIWQSRGITIILVTHSIEEAVFLGQKIIVLTGQPGQVLDIVDNPQVGKPGYRKTTQFHQLTSTLREKLIP